MNSIVNLRFDRNSEGQVGWYDTTSPAYTVWNPETRLFSSLYTPYSESFREFYEAMCRDIALWGKKGGVQPQGNFPPNVHNISSIPWLHYTEINLNLYTDGDFLPAHHHSGTGCGTEWPSDAAGDPADPSFGCRWLACQ